MIDKSKLRKIYTSIKHQLLLKDINSNNYHCSLRDQLTKIIQQCINFPENEAITKINIGTYLPIPSREINPPTFKHRQPNDEKLIKLSYFSPVFTEKDRTMQFAGHNPQKPKNQSYYLTKFGIRSAVKSHNQFQIKDKQSLCVLLVPLTCFCSQKLQRVGYGGGYYDKFIQDNYKHQSKNFVTVGIGLQRLSLNKIQSVQMQGKWSQHDMPLKYVITQKQTYDSQMI